MNEVTYTLILVAVVIAILCIIFIYFSSKYQTILQLLYKIEESEKLLNKSISTKYDLITRSINIIESKLKLESKNFEKVKKINIEVINNFELDKILSLAFNEILQIKGDYTKLSNVKSFKGIIDDLNNTELHLISLRTFYNKSIAEYNNLIKSFTNKILAKIKKLKLKEFYEGKELEDDLKRDIIIELHPLE